MQTDFQDEIEVCRPVPIRSHQSKTSLYSFRKDSMTSTPKNLKSSAMLSSLGSSTVSTLRDSDLTFSDFENGIEEEMCFDEIHNILRGDCFQGENGLEFKERIERPKNPFYKNLSVDDF